MADVMIAGGGVIGLTSAWRLAARGFSVVVADPAPATGASWVAAGMLAPVTEVHYGEDALLKLNLAAAGAYPSFVAELESSSGQSVGYRRCGTVMVARDADENAALEELFRFQASLGLEVERLRTAECRELEPGLSARVRGGIHVPGDHQIDNRALLGALVEACHIAGVEFVYEAVRGVVVEGERVAGVALGSAVRPCGTVIIAAGCRSGAIDGIPDELRPPIRPVKGQLVHLLAPLDTSVADRNVRGLEVYIVSRGDGRTVVGATVEEQGFDSRVTAGGVYQLLRDAYELLPGIIELQVTETIAGLRPTTPDNAPLIGHSGIDGLLYATGHYRNGVLLASVTADAIAQIVSSGSTPEGFDAFRPERFAASREVTT